MNYSEEQLDGMYEEVASLAKKKNDLMGSYVSRQYRSERANEYSRHGFCRRLQIMAHCIEQVFGRLPPESDEVPEPEAVLDATVYLQAFVFNTFGSIDNLAHIWVSEKEVKQVNGKALSPMSIGFGRKYTRVMESLPQEFRQYLSDIGSWWEYLSEFRHALSHRIPLYIPPNLVAEDKVEEYRRFEARMHEAKERGEYPEIEILEEEQDALVSFLPVTTHSFDDQAKFVFFHCQMLSDFNTIEEMAGRMLRALDE